MNKPDVESTDEWILAQRGPRNAVDPSRPYAFLNEREFSHRSRLEDVSTVFLTNSECPFRCLMCDLWKNTTSESVQPGQIVEQIRFALDRLPPAPHIKLYNSGNFFDPNAIPECDHEAIAESVSCFDTVIVESHPKMIGRRCFAFREMLDADMHVAMGLETIHPEVLRRLNKRMTLDDFSTAVRLLRKMGVGVRAFILLRPPFMTESEGIDWAKRSIEWAFEQGVECCTIIPTRAGNGAMETLARSGDFTPPAIASLEEVVARGLSLHAGRVFADLWDIAEIARDKDREAINRLNQMNRTQIPLV